MDTMKEKFELLENTIKKECGGKPVLYTPNPGNWGDAVIRHGTLKFFKDINLDFTEVPAKKLWQLLSTADSSSNSQEELFIYGGGGAWCTLWNHAKDRVTNCKNRYRVLVLPSTYENTYSISNTLFFRRDFGKSKLNMPNSLFCHDMAFYVGRDCASSFVDLNQHRGSQ